MSRIVAFITGMLIGVLVGRNRPTQSQANDPKPGTARPQPRPTSPAGNVLAPERLSDMLTEIDGIGPAFEQALNKVGISTFSGLARQTPEDLAARLSVRVTAERIRRDRWIEQAIEKAKTTS